MKAIVQDAYGPADVLELRDIGKPEIGDRDWCIGSYAEYVSASEDALVLKPANLTFEQAASVPMAGLVALQALRDHGSVDNHWFAGGGRVIQARVVSRFANHTLRPFLSPKREDLVVLKELIEAGKVTPVVDRSYPLSDTPLAIRHVGEGHARG